MAAKQATVVLLCLVALSCALVAGTQIQIEPCKNVPETAFEAIASVDITPCPSQPCVFHKGTIVNGTIKFKVKQQVTNGTLKVYGELDEVWLPFPLDHPDACSNHGLDCPLKPEVEYTGVISLEIKKYFPSQQLKAKMLMLDQGKKYVFCFIFPAQISDITLVNV